MLSPPVVIISDHMFLILLQAILVKYLRRISYRNTKNSFSFVNNSRLTPWKLGGHLGKKEI